MKKNSNKMKSAKKISNKRSYVNSFGFGIKEVSQDFTSGLVSRIMALLDCSEGQWMGTITEFSRAITTGLHRRVPANWPKNPSIMRRYINTVATNLRKEGIRVQFGRGTDHNRTRFVGFEVR